MKNHQEAVKIKIITGPNEGAVSVLNTGRYSFGKDNACDLIIHDDSIADHHMDLEISTNNIILFPLGDEVFINDKLCDVESLTLALFETVSIGDTQFVIGPEHSNWPDLINFKPDDLQPANDITTDVSDSVGTPNVEETKEKSLEVGHVNDVIGNLPSYFQSIWKKFKWLFIGLISFYLLIVIGSKLLSAEQSVLPDRQVKTIDSILQDFNLSESLMLTKSLSGSFTLKGYLDDDVAFRALKETINKQSAGVIFNVRNTNQLTKQAQDILNALNFPKVTLTAEREGNMVASGYINGMASWNRTKIMIQQDIKGIRSIKDGDLKTQETFIRYLKTLVGKLPLGKWLVIQGGSESIKISGNLSESEYRKWGGIKSSFSQRYGSLINLDDKVTTKSQNRLKLAIKSVSIGDVSYVMLKDNNKYMVGSMIAGEYRIEAIKPNKLVLSKDRKQFDYFIGEGKKL